VTSSWNLLGSDYEKIPLLASTTFRGDYPGVPRDEELATLRRELARVKKERDFLRDAAAFFAKESS